MADEERAGPAGVGEDKAWASGDCAGCASKAAWRERYSSIALRWNDKLAFSALFISRSFGVRFVLRAGRDRKGGPSVSDSLAIVTVHQYMGAEIN